MARVEVRAGAGVRAFRTVLRICCKLSSEYLGTLVAAIRTIVTRSFALRGLASCLENSDSGGGEESRRVMKRRSRQGQSRSQT